MSENGKMEIIKLEYWDGSVFHCRRDTEIHKMQSLSKTRELMRRKFLFLPLDEQLEITRSLVQQKKPLLVTTEMEMTEEEYAKVGYKK